jgi:hypothetical protein
MLLVCSYIYRWLAMVSNNKGREEEEALVMAWFLSSKLTGVRITVRFSSGTEPEQPLLGRSAPPCQRRIALPFITL